MREGEEVCEAGRAPRVTLLHAEGNFVRIPLHMICDFVRIPLQMVCVFVRIPLNMICRLEG